MHFVYNIQCTRFELTDKLPHNRFCHVASFQAFADFIPADAAVITRHSLCIIFTRHPLCIIFTRHPLCIIFTRHPLCIIFTPQWLACHNAMLSRVRVAAISLFYTERLGPLLTETLHVFYSQCADFSVLETSMCVSIHLPESQMLMATMNDQHACCGGAAVCRDAG